MFNCLRKTLLHTRPSFVKSISTDSTSHTSYVVSYLINTCKIPLERAITAPKKIQFDSPENPDSVITLFKTNSFSNTQITKIIGKYPLLLLCNVDKTLKPKFDFFKSHGISGSDFGTVVCQDPRLLVTSLDRRIIPYFSLMKSIIQKDDKLLALLKHSPKVLMQDPQTTLVPNIALLQANNVPMNNIAKLLVSQPMVFLKSTSRFGESVEKLKKLKFDTSQYLFLTGLHGFHCMTTSTLEAKFDVYRKWGLSEDELKFIFRKNPRCMMISEKNIVSTMNYYVNELGYTASSIAKQPDVIMFSLKRRIIPRCSVIQVLHKKGLFDGRTLNGVLKLPEESFLEKYVTKFEKEVPELLSTYRGKVI